MTPETEIVITLDVEDAQQMQRDIRRVLASRKALKRILNAITVIQPKKWKRMSSVLPPLTPGHPAYREEPQRD